MFGRYWKMKNSFENRNTNGKVLRLDDMCWYAILHIILFVAGVLIITIIGSKLGGKFAAKRTSDDKYPGYEFETGDRNKFIGIADNVANLQKNNYKAKEYAVNSVITNLNYSAVVHVKARYKVTPEQGEDGGDVSGIVKNVLVQYQSRLNSDDIFDAAAEAVGSKPEYIADLVKTSVDASASSTGIVEVTIIGGSEEFCRKIEDAVTARVNALVSDISASYGKYSVELLSEDAFTAPNTDVQKYQIDLQNQINNTTNAINSAMNSLTSAQSEYVIELVAGILSENYGITGVYDNEIKEDVKYTAADGSKKKAYTKYGASFSDSAKADAAAAAKASTLKKFKLLSVLAGIILMVFVIGFKYLYGRKLSSAYEPLDYADLTPLVCINGNRFDSFLRAPILKLRYKCMSVLKQGKTISALIAEAESNGVGNIFVATTKLTKSEKSLISELEKKAAEKHIKVTSGEAVDADPAAIKALSEADAIILLEQEGATSKYRFAQELIYLSSKSKNVLGTVVLS